MAETQDTQRKREPAERFADACDKLSAALNANDKAEVLRLMEFAKGDATFKYWPALQSACSASIWDRLRDNPVMMCIAEELHARGLLVERQVEWIRNRNARLLACAGP